MALEDYLDDVRRRAGCPLVAPWPLGRDDAPSRAITELGGVMGLGIDLGGTKIEGGVRGAAWLWPAETRDG